MSTKTLNPIHSTNYTKTMLMAPVSFSQSQRILEIIWSTFPFNK